MHVNCLGKFYEALQYVSMEHILATKFQETLVCFQLKTIFHFDQCIGFTWQGFCSKDVRGGASLSRAQQMPQVRSESAPASSKREPPLARAEPVSNAGWASAGKAD